MIGTKKEPCPSFLRVNMVFKYRLMIAAQVYNPSAFSCYQIGRPQSILMRIYLVILKCTHYLLHMYFRQFFLKSMYFSSCKIPENQESASLTVLNEVLPFSGYTMTPCMQKVFIAAYICLCDNSHIYMLSLTREGPYLIFGNKGKNLQLKLASFFCNDTQPFFVIR